MSDINNPQPDRIVAPMGTPTERALENRLRPKTLDEYVGEIVDTTSSRRGR